MSTPLAAAAGAETVYRYAEGDPIVLTVYFLAFGFWTAAAGNDFISSTWKSVRATRCKGKLHVVLVAIPMPYICAYMYFQHLGKRLQGDGCRTSSSGVCAVAPCANFHGIVAAACVQAVGDFVYQIDGVSRIRDTVAEQEEG